MVRMKNKVNQRGFVMKIKLIAAAVMSISLSPVFAGTDPTPLNTDVQKVSYSIGVDLGKNIKKQGIDLDVQALSKGIQDAMTDAPLQMSDADMKDTLMKFQKDLIFIQMVKLLIGESLSKNKILLLL